MAQFLAPTTSSRSFGAIPDCPYPEADVRSAARLFGHRGRRQEILSKRDNESGDAPDSSLKTRTMFLTAALVFGILWLLGLLGVYDLGVRTHVLLLYSVLCLLLAIFEAFRGKDAGKARAHGSAS